MWRGLQLKNFVIFVHRWMGVVFCLLFLLWFASGIVLMYWDYPGVEEADRIARAPVLDASRIRLSPDEAFTRLQTNQPPSDVRISTFAGRPVYRFRFGSGESIVDAVSGEILDEFPPQMTLEIAAAWTGQPANLAEVGTNSQEDQWTVSGEFRELRPMFKYSWPDGEQVYVSTVTGDVVQYTTRASRMGAYFGAIPHWLYFTPLRKHAPQWSMLVIWASGLATILAILGVVIGVWTFSPGKRYRYAGTPARIPYVGQKRWHMILGLIFGLVACTWAFSGMLSMDPFPRLQGDSGDLDARIESALRGGPLQMKDFLLIQLRGVLSAAGTDFKVKELELTAFAGEPAYLAIAAPNQTRVIFVSRTAGEPVSGAEAKSDGERIIEALRTAARPAALVEERLVTEYESYYLDRHNKLPLPVIFVRFNDRDHSTYYIDPKTARIVEGYTSNSRWNRWLYHGLHSMNLPWLYKHRPAWDIVVLTLLIGGGALCVTSLILAWRVLRRKLILLFAGGDDSAA